MSVAPTPAHFFMLATERRPPQRGLPDGFTHVLGAVLKLSGDNLNYQSVAYHYDQPIDWLNRQPHYPVNRAVFIPITGVSATCIHDFITRCIADNGEAFYYQMHGEPRPKMELPERIPVQMKGKEFANYPEDKLKLHRGNSPVEIAEDGTDNTQYDTQPAVANCRLFALHAAREAGGIPLGKIHPLLPHAHDREFSTVVNSLLRQGDTKIVPMTNHADSMRVGYTRLPNGVSCMALATPPGTHVQVPTLFRQCHTSRGMLDALRQQPVRLGRKEQGIYPCHAPRERTPLELVEQLRAKRKEEMTR